MGIRGNLLCSSLAYEMLDYTDNFEHCDNGQMSSRAAEGFSQPNVRMAGKGTHVTGKRFVAACQGTGSSRCDSALQWSMKGRV